MKENKVSYLVACVAAGLLFCADVDAMNWQQVIGCAGISDKNVAPIRQVNNQQRSVPQGNTQQQFVSQETASRLFGEVLAESENQANQIDRLKRENAQQVSDIEGFKESGIFKDARIDDLQRTSDFWENVANKQREKLGRASEHVNEKVHQIKALRRENAEQTDLINRLTGLVADKEDRISELKRRTDRRTMQAGEFVERLKREKAEQADQINRLIGENAEQADQINRLIGENAEQTDLINRLTGLVADKEDQIHRLGRENAQQANQINRINNQFNGWFGE